MATTSFSGTRVARVLASSTLAQVLSIAQNYLLVPLFLSAWGKGGYGQWVSLTALTSYLALADFGGQSFVGNRLAESYAQGRHDDFRSTLRQGLSLFTAISAIALTAFAFALLVPNLPWDTGARLVLFWHAAAVSLSVSGGVLVTCYAATGRADRASMSGVLVRLAVIVVSVFALRMKCTMAEFAGATFATSVVVTSLLVVDLYRTLGSLFRPRLSFTDVRNGVHLLRGSLDYWMFSLAGALNLQGIVLITSIVAGNASVAHFVTHRAAASLTIYMGSLLRPALWTEMTFMSARSDTLRLRSVVSLTVRLSTWCAAVAGCAICVVAPFGYALWTRSKLDLDLPLLVILVAQAILSAAWSAASWPLMAANQPRAPARWALANGALTIAGAYLSLRLGLGIRFVAAASLFADVVCGLIPIPIAAAAFLSASPWVFVRDVLRAALCAAPVAAAAYVSVHFGETDVIRLGSFGVACLFLAWPTLVALLGAQDLARIRTTFLKHRVVPSNAIT